MAAKCGCLQQDMEDADMANAEGGATARTRQRVALEDSDDDAAAAADAAGTPGITGTWTAGEAEAWEEPQQQGQWEQAGGDGEQAAGEDDDLLLPPTAAADAGGDMHDLFGDDDD